MSVELQTPALSAERREGTGKEKAKKLRFAGKVPAVIYGAHKDPVSVTLDAHEVDILLLKAHGDNLLLDINFGSGEPDHAFIKSVQRDPVTNKIVHVDLLRVARGEALTMPVRVHHVEKSTPKGLKNDGLLEQPLHEVHVRAIPSRIPKHIDVDLSDLDVGGVIHVGDLPKLEGVEYVEDPSTVVFSMVRKSLAVEAAPAATGAPVPGASPAPAAQ